MIDEKGQQMGVMPLGQALTLARERGLDLIEVAAKTVPPVCKIGDFGKFQYQKEKQSRGHKPHRVEIKGIRLGFNIAKHDIEMKALQAQKFLGKGDRVRVEIVLRGREKAFAHLAKEKLEEFKNYFKIPITVDQPVTRQPRGFYLMISKGK
ncbi:translation initiation factor IF-3 [Patescibacteria group bacterium]|nr:translation initiation factor IF-3 [Patescibacteria group bacterium]